MPEFTVSVIICTYNPNISIINRALNGLKNQTVNTFDWELIIVDNNSTDDFQHKLDISWHDYVRFINENQQGLTYARIAGMEAARGELLIFVDDDNVLDKDYLVNAIKIGEEFGFLGAWGGSTIGEFEVEPPSWFSAKYFEMLAVRTIDRDSWSNKRFDRDTNPIGAGLVIRKDVAEAYINAQKSGKKELVLDRSGDSLLSGGDNEIVYTAIELGYGTGNFQRLKLTHYITAKRLTADYMIKLMESIAMSNVILYHKYGRDYPFPIRPRGVATDVLYKIQQLRMDPIKKALKDAEIKGITRGKALIG